MSILLELAGKTIWRLRNELGAKLQRLLFRMAVHRIQELLGLMQKNLECSICLELMTNPVATKCDHYFCRFCITEFLETKRSVPCPLCKQAITKRSLMEKGELCGIVDAVNNLISAFQEDSGTVYSPPKGPQTFFPCTPEVINSKPDNNKGKSKKNVRNSRRTSKSTVEDSLGVSDGQSSARDADSDIFAVPSTSYRNANRRKSPASTGTEAISNSKASTDEPTVAQQRPTRDRSRTPTPATTVTNTDDTQQQGQVTDRSKTRTSSESEKQTARLLQYLDEGSCGFARENSPQENIPAPTHQPTSAPSEEDKGSQKLEYHHVKLSRGNKAVNSMEETNAAEEDVSDKVDPCLENEEDITRVVSQMNKKNSLFRPQADKENLIDSILPQHKGSKGEQQKSALAYHSHNSDASSVSSIQHVLRSPPAGIRTYGRRSSTRKSTERKVEEWIAAMPSGQKAEEDKQIGQPKVTRKKEHKDKDKSSKEPAATQEHEKEQNESVNRGVGMDMGGLKDSLQRGLNQDETEITEGENTAKETEKDQSLVSLVPEPDEFMLTPPIRKKHIFKRRGTQEREDANSPTERPGENCPSADPYFFVVGHTPVTKSKKRGRARSRAKKGNRTVPLFDLHSNENKTVRFSEVTSTEEIPGRRTAVENTWDINTSAETAKDVSQSETVSMLVSTNGTGDSASLGQRTSTRSRSKAQSLHSTQGDKQNAEDDHSAPNKKARRKSGNKADNPAVQQMREERTRELASWIGQAEDHELMFSTQDAQASMESIEAAGREVDEDKAVSPPEDDGFDTGVMAIAAEDDDSNDGFCLVGPVAGEKSSKISSTQQERHFDAVMTGVSRVENTYGKKEQRPADSSLHHSKGTYSDREGEKTMTSSKRMFSPSGLASRQKGTGLPSSTTGPTKSSSGTDTIAETQLSALESPASNYNIVLPSPMVESALPKFSIPIAQMARQRRSSGGGQRVAATQSVAVPSKKVSDETPKTQHSRQKKVEPVTTKGSKHASQLDIEATIQEKTISVDKLATDPVSPGRKCVLDENAEAKIPASISSNRPHHAESTRRSSGRLRKQQKGLTTNSPVTAVPSTFTEDFSAPSVISPSGHQITPVSKEREANHSSIVTSNNPDISESDSAAIAHSLPCKNSSAGGGLRERTMLKTQSKKNHNCDQATRLSLASNYSAHQQSHPESNDNETTVHMMMSVQNSKVTGAQKEGQPDQESVAESALPCNDDPEMDHDSSSTDDLDIVPDDNEYEDPDLDIQSEEVQQRYSEGLFTQGSLFPSAPAARSSNSTKQSNTPHNDPGEGLASRDDCTVDENTTRHTQGGGEESLSEQIASVVKQGRRHQFASPGKALANADRELGTLDSAVTLVPESLSSVTQIPDTCSLEVGKASNSTTQPLPSIPLELDTGRSLSDGHGTSQITQSHGTTGAKQDISHSPALKLSMRRRHKHKRAPQGEESYISPTSPGQGAKSQISASLDYDIASGPSSTTATPVHSKSQDCSSLNIVSGSSSATPTPSQSLLQPRAVVNKISSDQLIQQTGVTVTDSSSATPSPQLFNPVAAIPEPEPPVSPKFASPCKKKFEPSTTAEHTDVKAEPCSMGTTCPSQIPVLEEPRTKLKQTLKHKTVAGRQTDADNVNNPEEKTRQQRRCKETGKSVEGREGDASDEDGLQGNGQYHTPNLLVQETQSVQRTEEQSISLLSEQVISDSLPDDREVHVQVHNQDLQLSSDAYNISSKADRSSPSDKGHKDRLDAGAISVAQANHLSPLSFKSLEQHLSKQSCSIQDENRPLSLAGEKGSLSFAGEGEKRQKDEPSPSLKCNKRKLLKQHVGPPSKLSTSPCSNPHTPQLFSSASPSSLSRKIINSAPPGVTSVLAGSDEDDDAVLIVRRTKRKCFSLDGSPLKPKTLATKRRRFGGRQRNLSEKFHQQTSSNDKETHIKEMSTDEKDRNKHVDKDLASQTSCRNGVESTVQFINEAVTVNTLAGESATEIKQISISTVDETDKEERNDKNPLSKVSPLHHRKKTVRGLARDTVMPCGSPGENSNMPKMTIPVTSDLHQSKTDRHSSETESTLCQDKEIGSNERYPSKCVSQDDSELIQHKDSSFLHVHISDGEQLMEVDDLDAVVGSKATEEEVGLHSGHAKQSEHVAPSHPDRNTMLLNTPIHSSNNAKRTHDSLDRSILASQSSMKSQTQKPALVIPSSMQASVEDATIPPPSFDLQFDDEDDEEEEAAPVDSYPKQYMEKTAEKKVLSNCNSDDEVSSHSCCLLNEKVTGIRTEQDLQTSSDKTDWDKGQSLQLSVEPPRAHTVQNSSQKQISDSEESEEEMMAVKKKRGRAIIDSDSDSVHNSSRESEASFQLNFTSSSALSSQSEVPTTQERSKMESELDRLRKEIADMETKLQGRPSSSKSDSAGGGSDCSATVHGGKAEKRLQTTLDDSSDDEVKEVSGTPVHTRTKPERKDRVRSQFKKPQRRRRQRISSDEDEEEESRVPGQQLMDAYLSDVKGDDERLPGPGSKQPSLPHTPRQKEVEGEGASVASDEDSNDLFLSPLSPSPPPATKHSLARKEALPRSLFTGKSPSLSSSNSVTRIRLSLDFAVSKTETAHGLTIAAEADPNMSDDAQDCPLSNSGSLKKIPESQVSVTGGAATTQKSDQERMSSHQDAANLSKSCDNDAIDSSGSPLPSPLRDPSPHDEAGGHNQDDVSDDMVDDDDDDLPRWKRVRLGFISSGLDQEKSSKLRSLAERNECKVYSKFNDSVTHVIMRTDQGSRVCERTLKYFQGIAAQCWVLSYDWVLHSLAARESVPEKDYEIQGDSVKGDKHKGPCSSRLSTSPLLAGFAFASVGVSPDMSKKELGQLVTLGGGEVVGDPWDLASHTAKHKLVLRCVDSETQPPTPAEVELFNGQYKHFGLVTVAREWILDSICTHHLQKLDDYVFNTCADLRLPF